VTLQQAALDALALEPTDRLIDVSCGTGPPCVPRPRPSSGPPVSTCQPKMVARGRELAAGIPNVELREADAEALPFEAGALTAVLCTTSFRHYPRPERAIAEMARVLALGGRMVIADATTDRRIVRVVDPLLRRLQSSHVGCHRARDIEQLLGAAGLVEPRARSLLGGVYAIVATRRPAARTPATVVSTQKFRDPRTSPSTHPVATGR
jgi:ubiquinone/menaquinone biosynthesis C-methylase UbiE